MYLFFYSAVPAPGSKHASPDEDVVADVFCWVDAQPQLQAEAIAHRSVRSADWIVTELIEVRSPRRSDYRGSKEALFYFDEAVQEGAVTVIRVHRDCPESDDSCRLHG